VWRLSKTAGTISILSASDICPIPKMTQLGDSALTSDVLKSDLNITRVGAPFYNKLRAHWKYAVCREPD
jgi:hypothetical protein